MFVEKEATMVEIPADYNYRQGSEMRSLPPCCNEDKCTWKLESVALLKDNICIIFISFNAFIIFYRSYTLNIRRQYELK